MKIPVTMTTEIDVTPRLLAELFCGMDDEQQAQFFIDASAVARRWNNVADWQWFTVGRHLKTCACSTEDARDMVLSIADGLAEKEGGK